MIEWPLKHPECYARLGLKCPRGILLYGPPGCCKTTLVRAVATSCQCTFMAFSCAQLYSPYIGDAEKKIREVSRRVTSSCCAGFLMSCTLIRIKDKAPSVFVFRYSPRLGQQLHLSSSLMSLMQLSGKDQEQIALGLGSVYCPLYSTKWTVLEFWQIFINQKRKVIVKPAANSL